MSSGTNSEPVTFLVKDMCSRILCRLIVLSLALLVSACGAAPNSAARIDAGTPTVMAPSERTPSPPAPTAAAAPPTRAPAVATASPTREPTALPTVVASSEAELARLTAELAATVTARLPTPAPTSASEPVPPEGLTGVQVIALAGGAADRPVWAAASVGAAPPGAQHFVALFTLSAEGWQELSRVLLDKPTHLDEHSMAQVQVDRRRIWLEVRGRSGLIGPCCYDLLSFDGVTLRSELSYQERYFEPAVEDVDADGIAEVTLTIQPYGGASGWPQRHAVKLFRWDGVRMVEVQLAPVPPSVPDDIRRSVEQAVTLAQAELWMEAEAAINATIGTAPISAAHWNAVLIRRNAAARAQALAQHADRDFPHRFLYTLYYGDYPATLSLLRHYPLPALFGREPSLTQEIESLEGFTEAVATSATLAAQARPDLAAAYFLRGWSAYLDDPRNPAALADIERAAALAPDEPLFAASVAYLKRDGSE